jgi:carboxypeptidase C (cathepsin A)
MNTPETKSEITPSSAPVDQRSETKHSIKVGGKTLAYTVVASSTTLREETDKDGKREGHKARAQMFSIAYTLDGVKNPGKRPVVFVFNGGPGSSSVWLHLGAIGPRMVQCDAFGTPVATPGALVDNPDTLLAKADLVFIDPVGTGFSRMLDGDSTKEYHDYQRDLDSIGEFIRTWLSANGRWASPKYLLGESYGTTRACGLAAHLQDAHQIAFNGLVLISCALDFATLRFNEGNDLPYAVFLPSYAAAAHHHKRLSPALQRKKLAAVVKEAEAFAAGEYNAALFQGAKLPAKELQRIATRMAELTGLSAEYIQRANLRVSAYRFFKELLRDQGLVIGRFDARFTSEDRDDAGELGEADPSASAIMGPFGAQINHYLRHDLRFESALPYTLLGRLYLSWKWQGFEGRYPNVGEALRKVMHQNPELRVYVANGYQDLATPYFGTEYTLNHAITRPEMLGRIDQQFFNAGHMMYLHQPDLKKLCADLLEFVQ